MNVPAVKRGYTNTPPINYSADELIASRVTGWQARAACASTTLDMFDEPQRFTRAYCDSCPVIKQCKQLGDETQSIGVWGGEYRDISKGYRVHHRNGSTSREPYVSGLYVKGDNATYESKPHPPGSISTPQATEILGLACRRHLARVMRAHLVEPVVKGAGARPDYWDPDDVERVRRYREDGRDARVPDDAYTTQQATAAIGYSFTKSLYSLAKQVGVKPILRGSGKRQSFWAREDVERMVDARNVQA